MAKIKTLLLEIANELGVDDPTHDKVFVEYHQFIDKLLNSTSPCCQAKLDHVSYFQFKCNKCGQLIERDDAISNRTKV